MYLAISYDEDEYTATSLKLTLLRYDEDSAFTKLVDNLVTFCSYPLQPNAKCFSGNRFISGDTALVGDNIVTQISIIKTILNSFTDDKNITYVLFCKDHNKSDFFGRALYSNTKSKAAAVRAYKVFYEFNQ